MQEITVSVFRKKCLALMDHIPDEGILITRHGHPVAKLVPAGESYLDLMGSIPGLVVDRNDDLFSPGIEWNAES